MQMDALLGAILIGIVGGAIGSLFIRANNFINGIRKKLLVTKLQKIIDPLLLVTVTATAFYLTGFMGECYESDNPHDALIAHKVELKQFNCPDG
jgi:H+/Cl- antiporter ClcA